MTTLRRIKAAVLPLPSPLRSTAATPSGASLAPHRRPKSGWVRPSTLHFASRFAGLLVLVAMIATLEALLRKSYSENGVADVRDDDDSILWTTAAPATLFGLVFFYYNSADRKIRSFSPFVKLKRGKPFQETVSLDLLDKSRPRIVWSAARRFFSRNCALLLEMAGRRLDTA